MKKGNINILIINFDWRNIFENSFQDVHDKMIRDQLRPDVNNFFFYSWSNVTYFKQKDNFWSFHQNIWGIFFKPLYDLLSIWTIPRTIRKYNFKPDVVLVYDLGHVLAARAIKRIFGSKIIYCSTNMPKDCSSTRSFGYLKSIYSAWLEKNLLMGVDFVYTINETMKNFLSGLGFPKENIFIFNPNTISKDKKYIEVSREGIIRKKLGLSPDKKIILSVGRLEAEKNYPRLLSLFSKLNKAYYLVILGDGSMLGELKNLSQQLNIEDRVFFEGFVGRDKIWDYYKDAEVFVLLSAAEALGLVFWEAMYMGVPVLGSTAPGILETLGSDGERGMILRNGNNNEDFIKKIIFCTEPSAELNEMIKRAKEYVQMKMINDVNINKLIK